MKILRNTILIFLMINSYLSITAQFENEVDTFINESGWDIGDESAPIIFHNIVEIRMKVKKGWKDENAEYIITMKNLSDKKITFGARLANKYPTSSFLQVVLEPGKQVPTSEYYDRRLKYLFVLVRRPK